MLHDTPLITAISMGFVLAFFFGSLAQKFRLSPLVGYLFAGVMAGVINRSPLINLELDKNLLEQLAELGVILLMFGVGLHFSPKDLMSVRKISIPGALVQIFLATLMGAALLYFGFGSSEPEKITWGGAIIFGLSLSVASTVVLLRALEERSAVVTERGKIAVGWLVMEDIATVIALVILPALAPALGGKTIGVVSSSSIWLSLIQTIFMVTLFVVIMLTLGKKMIPWTLEKVAHLGSKELFTLSVLAIALGVALGAAYLFGVSLALGAFFAGMMLNESELSHEAAQDSLPLRDAFAVLFFVSVGLQLDLGIFSKHPFMLLGTFLTIVLGKSIGAYALVRAFRYSKETALTIAISLAQIGEFSFILINLGVSLSLVGETPKSLILSAAILSILVNPFLFKGLDYWIASNKDKIETRTAAGESEAKDEPEILIPIPDIPHAIIVGYGRVGKELIQILIQERQIPLVVIEDDPYQAEKAYQAGLPVVIGNAASVDVMKKANPATAIMVLIASAQPFESGAMIDYIHKVNPAAIIVARAETDAAVDYLLSHGVHGAVMEKKELAFSMMEMITSGERLAQRGLWPSVPESVDEKNSIEHSHEQLQTKQDNREIEENLIDLSQPESSDLSEEVEKTGDQSLE